MKKNYMRLIVALLFATNLMAQNVPNYVPTNGLVGWWPFNGNANDESGNGNNGTVNGATLTADRNEFSNSAYNFDGVNDFIQFNTTNLPNLKSDRTISIWFLKQNNNSIWTHTALSYGSSSKSNAIMIGVGSNNSIAIQGWEDDISTTQKSSNNWENITFSISKEIGKVYYNGLLIANQNVTTWNTILSVFILGSRCDLANSYFFGKIDDVAIYNRALTDQEIKQLYKGCTKETATSTSFNSYVFTNNAPINLSATPIGGTFSGDGIINNTFNPTKALLGKNGIKYNFKNTSGCADSTDFSMIMVDTLGNVCKKTINDTVSILKISFQLTTGIKANTVTNISVYPNPTSDVLIIDATDSPALTGYTYRILDVQGKQIYNALVTSSKTEITLKTLGAKGVYVLHIVDANGISIENKKIVLQ